VRQMKLNSLVYTYTLTKVLQDNNQDYLDAFSPFIVHYFKENDNYESFKSVQEWISYKYNFRLPLYIIKALIEKMVAQGILIKAIKNKFEITPLGKNYKFRFKNESRIEDFIESLLRDINRYLNREKHFQYYFKFDDLENYIDEHIDNISYFLSIGNKANFVHKQILENYLW